MVAGVINLMNKQSSLKMAEGEGLEYAQEKRNIELMHAQYKEIKDNNKGGAKKLDIFLHGDQLDQNFKHVRELDDFQIESKCRKLICELIKPMMSDMDRDRRNTAIFDLRV
jgi:hypothetical protein